MLKCSKYLLVVLSFAVDEIHGMTWSEVAQSKPLRRCAQSPQENILRSSSTSSATTSSHNREQSTSTLLAIKPTRSSALEKRNLVEKADLLLEVPEDYTKSLWRSAIEGRCRKLTIELEKNPTLVHLATNGKGIRLLSWAASHGQLEAVELLLSKGAEVDHCDIHRRNALAGAAGAGHLAIVKLLHTHKAKLDTRDIEGKTALHWAVAHPDIVAFLMQAEPHLLTITDLEGKDPLQRAAGGGHLVSVRLLIQADKNAVHRKDKEGRTALWWAAGQGHLDVCKELVAAGADINTQDNKKQTAVSWAAHKNREAVVRYLVEQKVDLTAQDELGKGPLHWAVEHPALVKLFLESGINPNVRDKKRGTALTWAAYFGAVESVKLLLEWDANPALRDLDGKSAANLAASNGHGEIVEILAATQKVSQDDLVESFHRAAHSGNIEVLGTILAHGMKVNARLKNGKTALMWAAANAQREAVRFLLSKKAHADIADSQGQTALSWAAHVDCTEVVRLLIDQLADPQSKDQHGKTPLHWARSKNVAELLLKAGALINTQDREGRTALSWACYEGRLELVSFLLTRGADINLCDKAGRSPLYWAVGHPEIVQMLVEKKNIALELCDDEGLNPLHCAVSAGNLTSVQILTKAGIDPEKTTRDGRTPLMLAVQTYKEPIAQFFLDDLHVSVDTRDLVGRNVIHISAYTGNYLFLERAVQKGLCDLNARCTAKGRTAIQWTLRMTKGAVRKEGKLIPVSVTAAIIAQLVAHGADCTLQDRKGKIARSYIDYHESSQKEKQLLHAVLSYRSSTPEENRACRQLFEQLYQNDLITAQALEDIQEEALLKNLQESPLISNV